MDEAFIQSIKDRIKLYDIISEKVRLRRSGNDWIGLCPFHKEKSPSFRVSDSNGYYHCFGCGEHGDIFTFIQKTHNVNFGEAVEILANKYGIALPARKVYVNQFQALYALMESIAQWFSARLHDHIGSNAINYLTQRHINIESIKKFRLGFCPDNNALLSYLKSLSISDELLIRSGVFFRSNYNNTIVNRYAGRIIFPIFDRNNHCIGFGGRVLESSKSPKYINSPETEIFSKKNQLYGYSIARHSKQIILVEGYLDVISLHQVGFSGAVAPLGTAISKEQIEMCWNVCDNPIVAMDGDNAGIMASYRMLDRILPHLRAGKSFNFAQMPQGIDPDILAANDKIEQLKDIFSHAISLSEWLWTGAFMLKPANTPEQKAAVIQEVLQKIQNIKDKVVQKLYVQSMKTLGHQYVVKKSVQNNKPFTTIIPVRDKIEKILLVTVINHPYILDRVVEDFAKIEIKNQKRQKLKERILELYNLLGNNDEKYIAAMKELAIKGYDMQDINLHAPFSSVNATDEEALCGWKKFFKHFSSYPNIDSDLQNAASDLKYSFSQDDWQRLKALKEERIRIKKGTK